MVAAEEEVVEARRGPSRTPRSRSSWPESRRPGGPGPRRGPEQRQGAPEEGGRRGAESSPLPPPPMLVWGGAVEEAGGEGETPWRSLRYSTTRNLKREQRESGFTTRGHHRQSKGERDDGDGPHHHQHD